MLQSMRSKRVGYNLATEQEVNLRLVSWESDTRMEKKLMQCADEHALLWASEAQSHQAL